MAHTDDVEVWSTEGSDDATTSSRLRAWWRGIADSLGTLKVRLSLGAIGALAVGATVTGLLLLNQVQRELRVQAQASGVVQSARLAADLSDRVASVRQALQASADLLAPMLAGPDDALADDLRARTARVHPFSRLLVAAPGGPPELTLGTDGRVRADLGPDTLAVWRQLVVDGRPALSSPVHEPALGGLVVVFAQPVVREGRVTAVVGGVMPLSDPALAGPLIRLAVDDATPEQVLLTDASGRVIAAPRPERVGTAVADDPTLAAAARDWAATGAAVKLAGQVLEQADGVTTVASVASTGWVVWRTVPAQALARPLQAVRLQALAIAASVILVLGAAIAWGVRQLLVPLRQLEIRARHLFDADRDIREGWPTASGEVGQLVHALRHVGAERVHLEAFTSELLGKLNSVMAAAPLGIAFTREGRFALVSAAWCRLLQRSEWQLLGTSATALLGSDEDQADIEMRINEAFARDGEYVGEWQLQREDGSVFWGQLSARPVDPAQASAGTIWTLADVTVSRASRESLEWSATHDALTGLANRVAFESKLRAVAAKPPAALIMIDLDRFKPINDTHGHAAGDAMLKRVAQAITSQVRAKDLAVRLGGDEFAVVLESCPPEAAQRVAESVQRAISEAEVDWEGRPLRVGASAGAAPLTEPTTSIEAWIAAADAACYAAKAAGRGTVRMAGSLADACMPSPAEAGPSNVTHRSADAGATAEPAEKLQAATPA